MVNMTARMRRLVSDWEQIAKDFGNHKYINITPLGQEPYERYHVTYFINGIYLDNGNVVTINRHEVEITLHADYPRYKPKCEILTPIYHPNFRDGQICIGDIWGAGESLSDIIINIGDMIQYKSWNSYSPLSAEAAQWALEHRDMFPVGNISLHVVEEPVESDDVEIDLFDEFDTSDETANVETFSNTTMPSDIVKQLGPNHLEAQTQAIVLTANQEPADDFEITADELVGIEYVPSAARMQSAPRAELVQKKKVNFKTVLTKGLIWAIIGAIVGFVVTEMLDDGNGGIGSALIARAMGQESLAKYYEYNQMAGEAEDVVYSYYKDYCTRKGYNYNSDSNFNKWLEDLSYAEETAIDKYLDYYDKASTYLSQAENNYDGYDFYDFCNNITKISTGLWIAVFALFVGLFMGIGEGVYYGSSKNAVKYALIGAGISLCIGFVSGYIAQTLYGSLSQNATTWVANAFIRAIGWAILGVGIGAGTGLIKPEKKRVLYCMVGGAIGGFIGGFLFDAVAAVFSVSDVVSRGVGLIVTGILIGIGVGVLEQFAKQAWLKVVRGEFEGKEYLVFAGTTTIGNNGQNIIVLFKDKLVAPHHCDIIQEGSKYVLVDAGSPLGTLVNGMRITKYNLRNGDSISIGNSVLIFNTK